MESRRAHFWRAIGFLAMAESGDLPQTFAQPTRVVQGARHETSSTNRSIRIGPYRSVR